MPAPTTTRPRITPSCTTQVGTPPGAGAGVKVLLPPPVEGRDLDRVEAAVGQRRQGVGTGDGGGRRADGRLAFLLGGHAGVLVGAGGAASGRRFERQPADPGEVDLGPGVGVLALHVVEAVVLEDARR